MDGIAQDTRHRCRPRARGLFALKHSFTSVVKVEGLSKQGRSIRVGKWGSRRTHGRFDEVLSSVALSTIWASTR